MGKLMLLLCFILSVFPADATENRRHIHVVRRGSKKSHRGDTVAKIWIEKNGEKNIEIAWSELTADEEAEILKAIDDNWEELNKLIDQVFDGKKIQIKEEPKPWKRKLSPDWCITSDMVQNHSLPFVTETTCQDEVHRVAFQTPEISTSTHLLLHSSGSQPWSPWKSPRGPQI